VPSNTWFQQMLVVVHNLYFKLIVLKPNIVHGQEQHVLTPLVIKLQINHHAVVILIAIGILIHRIVPNFIVVLS
jgi:hypothetical protein